MSLIRRQVLEKIITLGSIGLASSLSSCVSPGRNQNGTREQLSVDGPSSVPNPVIKSVSAPEPSIEQTEKTNPQGNQFKYHASVRNAGVAGDVAVLLYWVLEATEKDGERQPDKLMRAKDRIHPINSGSTRSFEFSTLPISDSHGFWFRTTPQSVQVRIKNEGKKGEVKVGLVESQAKDDFKVINMGQDEIRTETLRPTAIQYKDNYRVVAKPYNP